MRIETAHKIYVYPSGYDTEVRDSMSEIPSVKWVRRHRRWELAKTPTVAEEILKRFPAVECDNEFTKLSEPLQEPVLPYYDTEPWEHQRDAFNFAITHRACLLYMGMGTGKTKVTADVIVNLAVEKVLVFCPKAVIDVWGTEIDKHAPSLDYHLMVKGSSVRRIDEMKKAHATVSVCNYEILTSKSAFEKLKDEHFDVIVCDEIHRIKAAGGVISRRIAQLSSDRKIGLSGTPLGSGPLDAYAVFRFLDQGIYGTSNARFKAQYAEFRQVPTATGSFPQLVKYRNVDEFNKRFWSITHHVTRDELDLPDCVTVDRSFDLSPETRRIYDDLESEFYAEVSSGEILAANALVKLLRLQQITGGRLDDAEGNTLVSDGGKQALLSDILSDLDEPVVIFCRFRADIDQAKEACISNGKSVSELSGKKRESKQWMDGETDALVVQISSGKEGIDLTRARVAIYYSVGYSLIDYEQVSARIHRPGQTRDVLNIRLIANNTLDSSVYEAIDHKRDVIKEILR